MLSAAAITAWVNAGQLLVTAGAATYATIKGWIRGLNPNMTEEQLNAILAAIEESAAAHKKLADLDAGLSS